MEKSNELFLELKKKYGHIMKQRIGREFYVFLFDADDFETIFKAEGPFPIREELHIVTTYCRRNGKPIGMNGLYVIIQVYIYDRSSFSWSFFKTQPVVWSCTGRQHNLAKYQISPMHVLRR